jgi:hypothetical protein
MPSVKDRKEPDLPRWHVTLTHARGGRPENESWRLLMMRPVLSAWLPHWPITRLTRGVSVSPDRPLVTVETGRGVRHLVVVAWMARAVAASGVRR